MTEASFKAIAGAITQSLSVQHELLMLLNDGIRVHVHSSCQIRSGQPFNWVRVTLDLPHSDAL